MRQAMQCLQGLWLTGNKLRFQLQPRSRVAQCLGALKAGVGVAGSAELGCLTESPFQSWELSQSGHLIHDMQSSGALQCIALWRAICMSVFERYRC